jgi:hypothetical protein
LSSEIQLNWNARDPSNLASEGVRSCKGAKRGPRILLLLVPLGANPRPLYSGGARGFVMLAIHDERDDEAGGVFLLDGPGAGSGVPSSPNNHPNTDDRK